MIEKLKKALAKKNVVNSDCFRIEFLLYRILTRKYLKRVMSRKQIFSKIFCLPEIHVCRVAGTCPSFVCIH